MCSPRCFEYWSRLLAPADAPSDGDVKMTRRGFLATPGAPVRGILADEGCDFLEGRIDCVQEAYDRGLRSLQLVHYRVNELGDIQTEPAVHGGLTGFGKEVVR